MPPDHTEERATITAAADRLIANSVDAPSVADLVRAAGVKRWILTHRHVDLMKDFQNRVIQKWGDPKLKFSESGIAFGALQEKYEKLRQRNDELEELVNIYAHALEELKVENNALRSNPRKRADRASNVTPMNRPR